MMLFCRRQSPRAGAAAARRPGAVREQLAQSAVAEPPILRTSDVGAVPHFSHRGVRCNFNKPAGEPRSSELLTVAANSILFRMMLVPSLAL